MKNWYALTKNGASTLSCLLGLQQSVNATVQLWYDLQSEGFTFLMTSCLNTDALENLFGAFRMHGGTYNRNPSAKMVRLFLRKNILLRVQSSSLQRNCMPDEDVTLLSEELLLPKFETTTSENADVNSVLASMSGEGTDVEDTDYLLDLDNALDKLSTSVCSLESCAVEYFAGYIVAKWAMKSKCTRYASRTSHMVYAR
ncbi:hypothetical protein KPH14_012288 [Odynerus spinipes]|uniref:Uncharacterized protein n=1 Tax=Odynerus spinipes TaxID=1348599 RepID=A0AAD9VHY9_9HYME|nr:hypothetical protein KPH14_012288 [Odynerus spinipes]